jgi:hypothetical protein
LALYAPGVSAKCPLDGSGEVSDVTCV